MFGLIFFVLSRALGLWLFDRYVLKPRVNAVVSYLTNVVAFSFAMMDVLSVVLPWGFAIYFSALLIRHWKRRGFANTFAEDVRPKVRVLTLCASRLEAICEAWSGRFPVVFDTLEVIGQISVDPMLNYVERTCENEFDDDKKVQ